MRLTDEGLQLFAQLVHSHSKISFNLNHFSNLKIEVRKDLDLPTVVEFSQGGSVTKFVSLYSFSEFKYPHVISL